MTFELIQRNKTPEIVAEQILKQIQSGQLPPGSRLPSQRELSELLGVGRSSVREAVNALAVIGYLKIQQGKGTFIQTPLPDKNFSVSKLKSALGASSLLGLKEVQVSLECKAARLAAQRADEKQIQRLKAALDEMKTCKSNYQKVMQADKQFHMILAESSENNVLTEMIALTIQSVDSHYASFDIEHLSNHFINETIRSFDELVKALQQKDGTKAAQWMTYHVNLVIEEFGNIIKA